MNRESNKIKNIILDIEKEQGNLDHKDVKNILVKFYDYNKEDTKSLILDEYNKIQDENLKKQEKIKKYNIEHHYDNPFADKGIYTINDLYKYMNDNFEYGGVLEYNERRWKLPFGPVNGAVKNNKIVTYYDEDVFNFIIDFYSKLKPDDEIINNVKKQYVKEDVDICQDKEYQAIINTVSGYVQTKLWKQRNVSKILDDQISNCYESSYLVGEFLKLNDIKYQKYLVGRYDNIYLAHMFITYNIENKWYYFEHALRDFKGLYEYDSKNEMEQDIFVKFIYNDNYKMEEKIDFDNYFLKPIKDLDPLGSFTDYFKYFSTVDSIKLRNRNYEILTKLTDAIFKEIIKPGLIHMNGESIFYTTLELPQKEEYYDKELWNKKVFHILRKNIINLCFYYQEDLNSIYTLCSQGGFYKYNNIVVIDNEKTRFQILYNKILVSNLYNIKMLKKKIEEKDNIGLKEVLTFSTFINNKEDLYEYTCYFATELGKQLLKENDSDTISEIDLNDIDLNAKINNVHFKLDQDNFLKPIVVIAQAIEILNDAVKIVINKDYQKDLINCFVDYLVYMMDVRKYDIKNIHNNESDNSQFVNELVTKLLSKLLNKIDSQK